jgi:hypothetical protein
VYFLPLLTVRASLFVFNQSSMALQKANGGSIRPQWQDVEAIEDSEGCTAPWMRLYSQLLAVGMVFV